MVGGGETIPHPKNDAHARTHTHAPFKPPHRMPQSHDNLGFSKILAKVPQGITRKVSGALVAAQVVFTGRQFGIQLPHQRGRPLIAEIAHLVAPHLNLVVLSQPIHDIGGGTLGVSQNGNVQ